MKKMFKLFVVALAVSVPAYLFAAAPPEPVKGQVMVKDNFSGKKISDLWTITTGGEVTVTQADGSMRIYGPYLGYAQNGGNVLSAKAVPANDFRYSVDILEPGANSTLGTYACINVNSDNGTFATVQHWAGAYRLAYGTPSGWTAVYMPEFGDESTTWHNYKIVYDSVNKTVTAYVDEKQLGPVQHDLGANVYFGFFAHGSSAGTLLDVIVDNAVMLYKK